MTIVTEYSIGDIIYLKTDPDQWQRIITSIFIEGDNHVKYGCVIADEMSVHQGFELSKKKKPIFD